MLAYAHKGQPSEPETATECTRSERDGTQPSGAKTKLDHNNKLRPSNGQEDEATKQIVRSGKSDSKEDECQQKPQEEPLAKPIELRLLVRRREAGALIGKRGSNIKRLRETYRDSASFSIPDTGNGPERVVSIVSRSWTKSMEPILGEVTRLLLEKSPSSSDDQQIELKILIHSLHAGSIIGIGGQTIKKLRTDSKAAIKIFEMCCPLSSERVCAIKSRPSTVVSALKMILEILQQNPIGKQHTSKPYDALNFDTSSVEKYGGYLPEEFGGYFRDNCQSALSCRSQQVAGSGPLPTAGPPTHLQSQSATVFARRALRHFDQHLPALRAAGGEPFVVRHSPTSNSRFHPYATNNNNNNNQLQQQQRPNPTTAAFLQHCLAAQQSALMTLANQQQQQQQQQRPVPDGGTLMAAATAAAAAAAAATYGHQAGPCNSIGSQQGAQMAPTTSCAEAACSCGHQAAPPLAQLSSACLGLKPIGSNSYLRDQLMQHYSSLIQLQQKEAKQETCTTGGLQQPAVAIADSSQQHQKQQQN